MQARFHAGMGAAVILFEVFLNGLLLGGMYGLVALGLNLQYGVARILNLSYGEFFLGGAFAAFFSIMLWKLNPLLSLFISLPIAFAINWLMYQYLMMPLIRRAPDQDGLDADVVLVTFGLLFVFQGLALVNWSGEVRGYSFLSVPVNLAGATVALNRLAAFLGACLLALVLFVVLRHTRVGGALRAITIDPLAASIVGVDVRRYSALAFAAGGALAAAAGMLVSTFISFSATTGVEYTLKALIVVIMAGVGRVTGTLAAGLLLGVVESLGGYLLDPALTIAINFSLFMMVLLLRPTGLFTRA
jgi:branched-chain amino acid transport system permease protein